MGCYVGIATANGSDVKSFPQEKWAGAREFIGSLGQCDQIGDDWSLIRPKDIASAQQAARSLETNQTLYAEMLAFLRANPDHWLSVSY